MTLDEFNKIRSIHATFENAIAQTDLFWMKELMASGLMSLDYLVKSGAKQHTPPNQDNMLPCPDCNPTGVFNYSPNRDCRCGGRAYIPKLEVVK